MKILAYAASNSSKSINKTLVTHAVEVLRDRHATGAEVNLLDLNDFEMPIFSIDREERDGFPDEAQHFHKLIEEADGVIISFAEHNGSYTAAWKNVFDWMSRIDRKVFHDKPCLFLSASPGKGGAARTLKVAVDAAPRFGGEVVGHMSVPLFGENFDRDSGRLTNPELVESLDRSIASLTEAIVEARSV